jgi:hypothetical protein
MAEEETAMALGMFTGSGREYDARLNFRPSYASRGSGSEEWAGKGIVNLLGTGVRGSHIWDGVAHWDVVQAAVEPDLAWDGSNLSFARVPEGPYMSVVAPHVGTIYYITPTEDYTESRVREILADMGAHQAGIELDEPEFWSRAGHGEGFKREWQAYYGEPWRDPASSFESRYKASQLMSYLMLRMVRRVFQAVKKARPGAFCMVNPHSPFSYAETFTSRSVAGDIISTIGELAYAEEADAVLGEVWSDTIKASLVYRGGPSVEPFLHSWVDRSLFENLGHGTGKRIFQLLDPKSDDPKFPWGTYRDWFQQDTLAALMVGGNHFWVAWPDRLYTSTQPPAGPAPEEYKTVFTTVMGACRQAERFPARPETCIGVPVSDTIMWQRDAPGCNYIDAFYALTFPLLDQGIPVDVLPIECAERPGYLDHWGVLLTSFEYWNPQRAEYVQALADWVRQGGTMVYWGASEFDEVPSAWWRRAGYASTRAALFDRLGLPGEPPEAIPLQGLAVAPGLLEALGDTFLGQPIGGRRAFGQTLTLWDDGLLVKPHLYAWPQKAGPEQAALPAGAKALLVTPQRRVVAWEMPLGRGRMIWVGLSPWFMGWGQEGVQILHAVTAHACARAGAPFAARSALDVRRGPYRLVYAFADATIEGPWLDLLDERLRPLESPRLHARQYAMLYDIQDVGGATGPIFSGGVTADWMLEAHRLSATIEGPHRTVVATALRLPAEPKVVSVLDVEDAAELLVWKEFDAERGILRMGHRGAREKAHLIVEW